MKNPNLIPAPFAQNGHRDEIPASHKSDLPSQKATWDTGFPQITMMPVTAGGLPPSGKDFNGVFNQISDNIVHLSKGGKYKFSQEYANSINGYPKGAILQSDDETKEFQSLIDNNKINFNTESADKINSAWKLVSTNQILDELNKKLNRSDVVQSIGSSQSTVMSQRAVTDELNNIKTPASITQRGIVQLNNAVDSNNETQAATPRAVKAANDLANTAIQNAANANNNANSRLEKDQNGADIPNKPKFVDNLGLTDTVERAKNAASLTEWTPQIFNSDVYAKTIISGLPGGDRTYLEVVNAVAMWQAYEGERNYTLRHPAKSGTVAIIEELYKKSELYTVTESNNRFGYKNDAKLDQNGWWKCGDKGVIFQWGYTEKTLAESSETITFSTEFPHACFGGMASPSYPSTLASNSSAYFFNLNDGKRAIITCDQSAGASDDGSYIFWWAVGI